MLNLIRRSLFLGLLDENMRVLGYLNPGYKDGTFSLPKAGKVPFTIVISYYSSSSSDKSYDEYYFLKGYGSLEFGYGSGKDATLTISTSGGIQSSYSAHSGILVLEVDE